MAQDYVTVPQEIVDYYPSLIDDYLRAATAAATAPAAPTWQDYLAKGIGSALETFTQGYTDWRREEWLRERQAEAAQRQYAQQVRMELERERIRDELAAQRERARAAELEQREALKEQAAAETRRRYAGALGEIFRRRTGEISEPVLSPPFYDVPEGAEAALDFASPTTTPEWYVPQQEIVGYETRKFQRPFFEVLSEVAAEDPEKAVAALEGIRTWGGQSAFAEMLKGELPGYAAAQEARTEAFRRLADLRLAQQRLLERRMRGELPEQEYQRLRLELDNEYRRLLLGLREREIGLREELAPHRIAAMEADAAADLARAQALTTLTPARAQYYEALAKSYEALTPERIKYLRARAQAMGPGAARLWEIRLGWAYDRAQRELPGASPEQIRDRAMTYFERLYPVVIEERGPRGELFGTRRTTREFPGAPTRTTTISPEAAARELVRLSTTPDQARLAFERLKERLGGSVPETVQKAFDDAMRAKRW
ncbi:MAG: hypothetical protein QN130_12465 [Armatimonadota bacterium]|nr:hypothetical protein [Armatimonadota bacterium]